MRFLRTVIADAHPRKPMAEPSNSPSATPGWKTRGLDGDAFGAEDKPPGVPDQTSPLSSSLPIREGENEIIVGDAPALFQGDDPVNRKDVAYAVFAGAKKTVHQAIQGMGSNVESDSPLSVPVDKSGPTPDDESSIRLDPVNPPDRESGSERDKASETEGSMTLQPAGTVIPDSRMTPRIGQEYDPSIAFPQTHGVQNRASGHEGIEPVSSPPSFRDTLGKELTGNDGNSALQVEKGAGQLGVHEPASLAAGGNPPARGQVAGATAAGDRRHSESLVKDPDTLTKQVEVTAGKALQASPSVDKQAEMKSLSNREEAPRLQKPDAAEGVLRDVQLGPRQATVMESPNPSDMEPASVPQSAGKKASTSASSPGSRSSKSSNPVQHIARPARPSAGPEAIRSVPARLFKTDLMPKDGDSFHSRAPLRSPEKKHEAPNVQIGRIDVIIEAAAQPATKPAPASSPIDLASRHYLRRL